MSSKELGKEKLTRLIEEYQQALARGDLRGQSEATARTWVERFLTVFGWDPAAPRQVRQEYRIRGRAERRLQAEGTPHRRPDYCLLANGQRTLYIDVKKYEADIEHDAGIAYQVRCYGWSEGFRLSYAFDFDELAIFDCRLRPDGGDEADVARAWYVRHGEYLDQFDRLWEYFAREAIESGSLARLHPADEAPRGSRTLDADFEERLSGWRRQLATTIMRYGKTRDSTLISGAAQRIIDRIVFLRMCEEFGLEEHGTLKGMAFDEDGFWHRYLEDHEHRWARKYDGMLFPASGEDDPTGIDLQLRTWNLHGTVFREIIGALYYPHPYKFDVMPIELLGGIYERYLGKRLVLTGNEVKEDYTPAYQRTQGAIYTPQWVVERVIRSTLGPLVNNLDPDAVLGLRVVDPACGSGGFLLGAYDYLEDQVLTWFIKHPEDDRRSRFTVHAGNGPRLSPGTVRILITECLYGVDIDPAAVEVARMSLALRYLERTAADEAEEPTALLTGIGKNIRQGNSLVGPDIEGLGLSEAVNIAEVMPFDWRNRVTGFGDVMDRGFDAVVGNPPYIEVKRYREWMPDQYRYLKESGQYVTTTQGKTDVAVPFMEQGTRLLRSGGRLGFIIQNRFFKTEYGRAVRGWLVKDRSVESIEDFRDLQVFVGRTTYTAIVILQKDSPGISYRCYRTIEDAQGDREELTTTIPWSRVNENPWSFDQPDLLEVHEDLERRLGTIGSQGLFTISVGLQTLWGKLYQLEAIEVRPRTVVARNGLGEEYTFERAALRPLCRNRGFYPFRPDNADAWVIFPYEIESDEAHEICWKQMQERFPKTAGYLLEHKNQLAKAVETEKSANRWHLYLYPKNLVQQAQPKVLFPTTIEDTIATVDPDGDVYLDNVRVNSLSFAGATTDQLSAIAAVINSSLFNALARLKAGLSDSGWRQFNRQFAELVPFPRSVIENGDTSSQLASLASRISAQQEHARRATTEGAQASLHATLDMLWSELDLLVEGAYGLSDDQRAVIQKYPRRVDRFNLLMRQAAPPEEEE